jgi:RecB family exonuclease
MKMPLPLSYSKLADYEKCPWYAANRYIIPGPRMEPTPAMARGTAIHADGERWLKTPEAGLPALYKPFRKDLERYKASGAEAEATLYIDPNWGPVATRSEAFLIGKLDLLCVVREHAEVVDYKTGKPYSSHAAQGTIYALLTFANYSEVKTVNAAMWYLDGPEIRDLDFRRANVKGLQRGYGARLMKIANDTEFRPTPSENSCKWCELNKKRKGGPCEAGV